MGNSTVDVKLQWLSRGPSILILHDQGYEINEYKFYTRSQDEKSTNQNSGVRMFAIDSNRNKENYYGVIEEIWELDYGPLKVPLFRCKWIAGGSIKNDN
jgi:acyl-ACP thioesterase